MARDESRPVCTRAMALERCPECGNSPRSHAIRCTVGGWPAAGFALMDADPQCQDCGCPLNAHDPACRIFTKPDLWQPGDGKPRKPVEREASDDGPDEWESLDAGYEADMAAERSWDLHRRTFP
jgi:hypothetical protein